MATVVEQNFGMCLFACLPVPYFDVPLTCCLVFFRCGGRDARSGSQGCKFLYHSSNLTILLLVSLLEQRRPPMSIKVS